MPHGRRAFKGLGQAHGAIADLVREIAAPAPSYRREAFQLGQALCVEGAPLEGGHPAIIANFIGSGAALQGGHGQGEFYKLRPFQEHGAQARHEGLRGAGAGEDSSVVRRFRGTAPPREALQVEVVSPHAHRGQKPQRPAFQQGGEARFHGPGVEGVEAHGEEQGLHLHGAAREGPAGSVKAQGADAGGVALVDVPVEGEGVEARHQNA